MIVACSAPPEWFALSGRGTDPDRNTTLFRSNRPIPNRRTPWMLLIDAFTIFPHRRKDWLEKQTTRWGEEESSGNVMHPYQYGKGNPRARRNQEQALARHPKHRSIAIFKQPSTCPIARGWTASCLRPIVATRPQPYDPAIPSLEAPCQNPLP